MDYSRPELADLLASEYVIGTLAGPARRRFESLLPAHPGLRQAVMRWQERLQPLESNARTVQPSPAVWAAIDKRLFGSAQASAPASSTSWWQSLRLWQGLSALSLASVLGLSLVLNQQPAAQAPVLVVLSASAPAGAAGSYAGASFVLSVAADGRALSLKPLDAPAIEPSKALELWSVPKQGAPRSLGMVSGSDGVRLMRAGLLQDTAAFAISVEPSGGSPTGAPTGPVISVGKL